MAADVLPLVFIAVSGIAFVIQFGSLLAALDQPRPGLVRTVACRVVAALAYVALGMSVLIVRDIAGVLALAVFTGTQAMWLVNTLADLRMKESRHG
jgi:hypothetical protein